MSLRRGQVFTAGAPKLSPSRLQAVHFKSELLDLAVQYVKIMDGQN